MDTFSFLLSWDTLVRLLNMLGDGPQELCTTVTADSTTTCHTDNRLKPRQLGRKSVRNDAVPRDDTVRRDASQNDNAPGGIRTHDPRFRKPVLYPTELRAPDILIFMYRHRLTFYHASIRTLTR